MQLWRPCDRWKGQASPGVSFVDRLHQRNCWKWRLQVRWSYDYVPWFCGQSKLSVNQTFQFFKGTVTFDANKCNIVKLEHSSVNFRRLSFNFSSFILWRFSPSGTYYSPKEGPYQSYIDYIRSLPLIPHPEVYGLHENADITKDNQETNQVTTLTFTQLTNASFCSFLTQSAKIVWWKFSNFISLFQLFTGILLTLPRQTGSAGKSPEASIQELADDILKKIPDNFDLIHVSLGDVEKL